MKKSTRQSLAILGAATLAFAGTPDAEAANIFTEDFQSPIVANGTQATNAAPIFAGWSVPGSNVVKTRQADGSLPGNGLTPNQGVQFEWHDQFMGYDTTHSWADGDQFQVSFNATEQNWSNSKDRYIGVRIRETVSGDLLWQGHVELAEYDAANTGAGGFWAANQTHVMNFSTADFGTVYQTVGGTEGSLLTFEIAGVDKDLVDGSSYANVSRGTYLDNISFDTVVIPEPSSLALLGLGGLLIARRRKD